MSILMKLVYKEPIEESDIVTALQETCEKSGQGHCNLCPVFKENGGEVPYVGRGKTQRCSCRMDGIKMLEFLRNKRGEWISDT
jgi:hypothetical protein